MGYSGAMMPDPKRFLAGLRSGAGLVLALLLTSCASAPPADHAAAPAANANQRGESESILAAETALRDGNCRSAAENYLAAARVSSDSGVAAKATQLAVGCDQLATAQVAAARWREMEPYSGDAALAAALVALKRYDLVAAREALTSWRDSGSAGSQDPLRFAELLEQETDATAVQQVFGPVLVGDDPTAEVLLAQAKLALSAQNMRAAIEGAKRALAVDTGLLEARTVLLRAQSVLGEHDAAIAGARELGDTLEGEDEFLLVDFLTAADRHDEARKLLIDMASAPATRLGAERRLVGLSMQEGDFGAAESRLEPLLGERGATAIALYMLAQLAERKGDEARAVQNYRLLADSSLALAARTGAARLMLARGDSKNALALLDDYAAQNPESAIDIAATRAQLLAQAGNVAQALVGLDAMLERYPDHPQLVYQKATVLETGGRTREAIALFERELKQRPDDPQLTNALGFTLADHGQQLTRAEKLVRQAIDVSPDSPAIQDSLGWVLFRRGRNHEALPVLERAWHNSQDGEIAAHYGEALWKSGNEGQARYIWQQALNLNPSHKGLLATQQRLTGETPARH